MNCRILFLLMLTAAPVFGQNAAPAKTYQWHHPWFKTEVTSATPRQGER